MSKNLSPAIEQKPAALTIPTFCFGKRWKRSNVEWGPNARILGAEHDGAELIDFKDLRCAYYLYKGEQVVHYASTDGLGASLYAHTRKGQKDWDHFTWMAIRPDEGSIPFEYCIKLPYAFLIIGLNSPCPHDDPFDGLRYTEYVQAK